MPDAPDTIPRLEAPDAGRFEREFRAASRPAVLTGLADGAGLRARWSLARLRAAHGGAAVPVARVRGRDLVVDPARGVVQDRATLGAFLDALAAGAPGGYLMAREEELPPALGRELEVPRYCGDAPWRVSRLWIASQETVSALHRDLADNLHLLVDGEKVFTLVSPDQSRRVYPHGPLSGMPNGARFDPDRPDYARFPRARGLRAQVVRLAPGETLFIPHGWWHHVHTRPGSVSVNTWWAKGWRLPLVVGADWFKRLRAVSR
jgi:hypothetical protein